MCTWIQSLTVNLISKKFRIISFGKQYFLLLLPFSTTLDNDGVARSCATSHWQPMLSFVSEHYRVLQLVFERILFSCHFLCPSLSPFRTSRNENACFCVYVSTECTTNNAEGNGPRQKIHSTAAAIAKVAILLMCVHRANTIDCVRAAVCTSSLFRFSAWRKRIVCDRAFSRV